MLLSEFGLKDRDLEAMSAKSLKEHLTILRGLYNRQRLEEAEDKLKK